MRLYVLPYHKASHAAREISRRIGAWRIKLIGSRWRPKPTRAVINWGCAVEPVPLGNKVLNHPRITAQATSKDVAFHLMKEAGVSVPLFTTDKREAASWFEGKKTVAVFCRKLLRSSGGKGIVVARQADELVDTPLYTKRIWKTDEYRVHVFNNVVIDVAKKALRNGMRDQPGRNQFVRNLENGWVFAHENVVCPEIVKHEALKAVAALHLDFGAVDVAIDKTGQPYVFEVNTAPGLENQQTINAYVDAFKNYKKKEEEKQNENHFYQYRKLR